MSTTARRINKNTYAILVSVEPAPALAQPRIRELDKNRHAKFPKWGVGKKREKGRNESEKPIRGRDKRRLCTVKSSSQRRMCQGSTCTRRRNTRNTQHHHQQTVTQRTPRTPCLKRKEDKRGWGEVKRGKGEGDRVESWSESINPAVGLE